MSMTQTLPWKLSGKAMEHFRRAVKTDDYCGGMLPVLDAIGEGKLQLWVWEDDHGMSVFVTEVVCQRDGSKELFVRMLSGEGSSKSYYDVSREVIRHAKEIGCSRIMAYMNPDLVNKLFKIDGKWNPVFDFEERYTVLGKDL